MAPKIPPIKDVDRYVKETVRELAALPLMWASAKLYTMANKLSPEKLTDPLEEDTEWQTETPEVTKWRHQRDQREAAEHPVDADHARDRTSEEAHAEAETYDEGREMNIPRSPN